MRPPRDDETQTFQRTPPKPSARRPFLLVVAGPRLGELFAITPEGVTLGRDETSQLHFDEEGVSRRHCTVHAADTVELEDHGSQNGTWVDGARVQKVALTDGAKIRIGQTIVLRFALYDDVEEKAQRQILEAALRDVPTRAFNRRYFDGRIDAELRFAERHRQALAVILIDVDHFKAVNDTYGHLRGDEVLRRLVEIFHHTLRAEDVLARYGGEEFVVLLRGGDADNAAQTAERLRRRVADSDLGITISAGVAAYPTDDAATETPKTLVGRADTALARAKQAGRNQVAR